MTSYLKTDGAAAGPRDSVAVTVVETDACHLCADAHDMLDEFARRGYSIEVTTRDLRSPEGQALMLHHRAALSPLVLVEGRFFSQGRLSRGKLARLLEDRRPAQRPARGA